MDLKLKLILSLIVIAVFDTIIPIPLTALLLIYVVVQRPPWFKKYADQVYKL